MLYHDIKNLDPESILFYKDKKKTSFDPIIVSFYYPINQLIVIDGNHRLYQAKQRKEKYINAFLIAPDFNKNSMNEKSLSLYSFHHNLRSLADFSFDRKKWHFESNKSLSPYTYYGDLAFKYVWFKKLILILNSPSTPPSPE